MKILYIVGPQQDYETSYILEGLCGLIGDKNVYVYPMLKRWKYGEPDDWYVLPDGKQGYTGSVEYEPVRPDLPELTIDEICERINTFDYIILASPRDYTYKSFSEIKNRVGVMTTPIIFIDGEDSTWVQKEFIKMTQPNVIFKRELLYDAEYEGKRIYPLPFAAFQSNIPRFDSNEKTLDVFGIFGNTNPLRLKMVNKFHELKISENSIVETDTGKVDSWDRNRPRQGKLSYHDYMKKISESKIGLSCIGHGYDTCRMWEIPGYSTLLLGIMPKIRIPFPFKDGETAVFLKDDLSDFEEKLKYYLTHDDERTAIAKAGYEHLIKFHTCKARANYMLSIAEGVV